VVDTVDVLVEEERLREVVLEEPEVAVADVLDVLQRAGVEVVDADHPKAVREEAVAEMRAEEPRASRDQAGAHRGARITAGGAGLLRTAVALAL
jgi:hypothetical protein